MERIKAENSTSGNVVSYGWQPESEGSSLGPLAVEFRTKGGSSVYQYSHVPEAKWKGLLAAPSAGAYINSEVKPHYAFSRIA